MYLIFKFVHILLVIVAVGFNASYPIWLARAENAPDQALPVLQGIKRLDDRFANPAYGLAFVIGVAMTFSAGIPLSTFWIAASLVLYVLLAAGARFLYSPTLTRQIATLESAGPTSPAYKRLSQRGRVAGILLGLDVVLIVYLMVFKPTL
jgi:uncharacterized membrane protein